jgi:RNA polymerase-binding transcription factor DksA
MCVHDCGSGNVKISKTVCIRCGNRTKPDRSRLTPSGSYICVECKKQLEEERKKQLEEEKLWRG